MTSGVTVLNSNISPLLTHPADQAPQPVTLTLDELFELTAGKSNPEQFAKLTAAKEAVIFSPTDFSAVASCEYVQAILEHPGFILFAKSILGEHSESLVTSQKELAVKYLQNFRTLALVSEKNSFKVPATILELLSQDAAKVCYMPGGWKGQTGQLVIIRVHAIRESVVDIRIINRAIGSQVHNSVEGDDVMNDLTSPAFLVDVTSDSGKQLFIEWSNLLFSNNYSKNLIQSDLDFYGRLLCYGHELPEADHVGRASKTRYTGGGSASSIISMLADIFHTAGISVDDHKKFVLVVKLFALMQEFASVESSTANQKFFQEAIDKMMVRAAKIGPKECNTALVGTLCATMETAIINKQALRVKEHSTGTRMPCEEISLPLASIHKQNTRFTSYSTATAASCLSLPASPKTPQELIDHLKSLQSQATRDQIALRA
ncbi:MAG: hypothetical protein LLF94_05005, partial [Chlamydiales bacterium]|nr:hypothetical protein [Chlamydiales bacterium]